MARMRGRILMGVAVTVVILIASLALAAKQVSAQNDIVSDLTARLVQRGVPVDSIRIASRLPFRIEAIIQSESASSQVAPGDPLSVHTVEREVALARSRYSIELDWVKVIIVNRQGEPIYWSDVPSRRLPEASAGPSSITDEEAAELVRSRLPQTELHLQALTMSSDANGSRVLAMQFTAESLDAVNRDLPRLSPLGTLRLLVDRVNAERDARIAVCRLDIMDAQGQPLVRYVRDVQLGPQNWWQASGVTQDWFPHPQDATPTSCTNRLIA